MRILLVVNVDDTPTGVNAGAWSVGVVRTGSELGLSFAETEALEPPEVARRIEGVRTELASPGL